MLNLQLKPTPGPAPTAAHCLRKCGETLQIHARQSPPGSRTPAPLHKPFATPPLLAATARAAPISPVAPRHRAAERRPLGACRRPAPTENAVTEPTGKTTPDCHSACRRWRSGGQTTTGEPRLGHPLVAATCGLSGLALDWANRLSCPAGGDSRWPNSLTHDGRVSRCGQTRRFSQLRGTAHTECQRCPEGGMGVSIGYSHGNMSRTMSIYYDFLSLFSNDL